MARVGSLYLEFPLASRGREISVASLHHQYATCQALELVMELGRRFTRAESRLACRQARSGPCLRYILAPLARADKDQVRIFALPVFGWLRNGDARVL